MRSVVISDRICAVRRMMHCQHSEHELNFLIEIRYKKCSILAEALCILLVMFFLPLNREKEGEGKCNSIAFSSDRKH